MNHWLFAGLVILHVFVCVVLVLLILVQNDKGGGLAGAFGGMGGSAAFSGSSASTFLTVMTRWIALASFVILVFLNILSTKGIESGRRESELKGARRGLSSVIPMTAPGNLGGTGAAGIPGLGGNSAPVPTAPAPAGTPSNGPGK